ncbi:MAG: DUF4276 family protein [Calditrichaeota bacterium]|nr:MAG: DUF4276 family protein [Calditrichota bacterium]
MTKILIYVEGQTEETFVRDLLAPYFWQKCKIILIPTLARTKRTIAGQTFKGGIVSYAKVKKDILNLLGDTSAVRVTTMLDFYGLPEDFPGKNNLPSNNPYDKVAHLEKAFAKDINHNRFLPFLILHEFESLIFVQPDKLSIVLPQYRNNISNLLVEIQGSTPEEINEGRDTHPSARISRFFPDYQKSLHGPRIVQNIGLEEIRSKCRHFNNWISKLESLCETDEN